MFVLRKSFRGNRILLCGEGSPQASLALNVSYLINSSPSMRRKTRTRYAFSKIKFAYMFRFN